MGKFIKPGCVVVVLQGRYAGRKAVVVNVHEEGHGDRRFSHCIVAGIDSYPKKITKGMTKKRIARRTAVKPFVKYLNLNHLMPTRYVLDVNDKLKGIVSDSTLSDAEKRRSALKNVKKTLDERYQNLGQAKSERAATGVQYFFQKLRF
uniref:KOW domain-containing protein n=1 Tax=Pseudictyota dubia TaxID=2749911 RepID=A0A7R9WDZ7_9STRA|mmetsp:Transcript_46265/g.86011  ORF Transcript_46265/g.86011 Transcript_46265/m.86011 type:complete len:148 (+) Transcript_46265:30-473(+)|eukprot:TRINITY_DN90335_c0_g1_i1.p2 TRINITY_DN90335_c0_g1~~TRINITY_DN90335_c0_g1_i1.p2  ORF type:complete len:148 (+),score=44.70 TRINITY_DN90335_c0_g1_i1:29-472(+)